MKHAPPLHILLQHINAIKRIRLAGQYAKEKLTTPADKLGECEFKRLKLI